MKLLKSYWATHQDECVAAITLIILMPAIAVAAHVMGLHRTFLNGCGMTLGIFAMSTINLVAHYNRINK
jgi:hypothetical protein